MVQNSKHRGRRLIEGLLEILKKYGEIELEKVDVVVDKMAVELIPVVTQVAAPPTPKPVEVPPTIPKELAKVTFEPPIWSYPGKIAEVQIGATKGEGGSRRKAIKIGGEKTPPFYRFEGKTSYRPVIFFDVFDMPIPLAKPVKEAFADVLEDPAAWAKKAVEKYGADGVTLHLISADPALKGTKPKEAAKTVEEVLQAVDVPIAIGCPGIAELDPIVLYEAAAVAEGERCILNSAYLDSDFTKVAEAAKKFNQVVLAWTQMDVNQQKELNRKIFDLGVTPDIIIQDPTTAALGYGLEYTFSIMERIRLGALKGDEELQMPMSSGTTNAWAAREAYMKKPEWGPRELRGPLWEAISAITLMLAGCDLFMMMHPLSAKLAKKFAEDLTKTEPEPSDMVDISGWVKAKF